MPLSGDSRLKSLITLLAAVMAMSPLAIDLYLPAMPTMSKDLNTTMPIMQNTLSIYLLGYAMGLMLFGPLSDTYARRKLVIFGVTGFSIVTILLPLVTSIEMFMGLRFCQAFVSSAAIVVVPATIRERYGKDTAKGLSYVSMVMMLAPMIAPAIGSGLLALSGWQLIFFVLTGYALVLLVAVVVLLPEKKMQTTSVHISFLARYKLVFSRKKAQFDLATSMIISLAFFSYITAIPFVYLSVFNVSELHFSILFGSAVFALMSAHFINTRLVSRVGSRTMLNSGLAVAIVSVFCLLLVTEFTDSLLFFVIFLLPLMGSISIIAVNSDALVIARFKHTVGTATAVIGVLRFGIGALAGPILAVFFDDSATPFVLLMMVCVLLVALFQWPMNKRVRSLQSRAQVSRRS